MSTSPQDTDDSTLGEFGNEDPTLGYRDIPSWNGSSSSSLPSNFFTDLVNSAYSGITSLFNPNPNPTSTSTSTSTSTPSTLSDSSSSSPSSSFIDGAVNAIASLFGPSSSSSSSSSSNSSSNLRIEDKDNQLTLYGKNESEGLVGKIRKWFEENPVTGIALVTAIPTIFNAIKGGGGGGSGGESNTTNQSGDTNNQSGDTNNQSGDTNNQSGDTNNQSGDTNKQSTAEETSLAQALGISAPTLSTLLKYGLPALASYLSYKSAKDAQEQASGVSLTSIGPTTATRTTYGGSRYSAAQGGVASLAGGGEVSQPFYLGGSTDGMADEVPAHIDNQRPAALSDGEFVIPADVVSHLGNGNSNAGAKRLYEMMDNIREARTGSSKQGIQINPNNFMPG